MAVYGISLLGEDTFGLSLPPAYLVDPMSAASIDYGSIRVQWRQPSGIMFRYRLLTNRYGYPVNENDGTIIYDSVTYPGSSYLDQNVIPGTYHYYAFYVMVDVSDNIWIRSGLTACLAIENWDSAGTMLSLIPECMKINPATGDDLTSDSAGNIYLLSFLNVLGWGMDYLKTQYNYLNNYLNDPLFIPLSDLWNMASEMGLSFSANMPAYTVRKAVLNWAHVSQERGTLLGITNEITLRTGWGADVQIGPNIVLEDDQAQFLGSIFLPYTPGKAYDLGECVWMPHWGAAFRFGWPGDGFWYECVTGGIQGISPPNDGTSNGNWHCIKNQDDFLFNLTNPATTAPSTWEVLDSTAANGIPAPAATGPSITQALGIPNPTAPAASYNAWNGLRMYNRQSGARTMWCRSVARTHVSLGTIPDPSFESGFTVPASAPVTKHARTPGNWPQLFSSGHDSNGNDNTFLVSAYWTGTTCTITRSQVHAHTGSWSMLVDPVAAAFTVQSPWIACPATTACTGSLYAYSPTAGTTVTSSIQWLDQYGNEISASAGTPVALTASTQTVVSCAGTAPAGTAYAALSLASATAGAVLYIDDTNIVAGINLNAQWPPDQINAVSDGIPVPWLRPSMVWNPDTRYATNDLVSFGGQPFMALRASTGVTPPVNNVSNNEWTPLSQDQRIRLCVSGYLSQDLSQVTNFTAKAIPFVEWFDQQGNYLARVFARNANTGGGIVARANLMAFDSFTTQSLVSSGNAGGSSVVFIAPPGWSASYYSNTTLSGTPVYTDIESSIDYAWSGSPAPGVPASGWSAKWVGSITAPRNGTYSFAVQSVGASQLFVGGTQVINNWSSPVTSTVTGTIVLTGGSVYTIEVDLSVPSDASDTYGPNLMSGDGTVTSSTNNPTSLPSFSVTPLADYEYSAAYHAESVPGYGGGSPRNPASQLTFYDASQVAIATATGVEAIAGTVPSGAVTAVVTVSGASGHTSTGGENETHYAPLSWSSFSYEELVTNITSELEVTSPFTYTWPGTVGNSFSVSSLLNGRTTDDEQSVWTVPTGSWTVGGFDDGSAWPTTPGVRSVALLSGASDTNLGATYRSPSGTGQSHGIVFRYVNDSNYWRAGMMTLRKKVLGVWTTMATYPTSFEPDDRISISLLGSAITVYRNGVQIASVTDAFNQTATQHGVIAEPQ
jgi:hypothetical protein